ncbi:TerD family protein [Pseudobacteroides cellulosolvens]|uniref:Stress protein n=1 Tax=Pseudobacteroides cellulosolvens ATCC 35603 = DSM 2933 TaxID=398512 RepID=A0A0L6JQQ7_9FIRM|nr:TerD family protein [Pseudobacteroides cellulosolvens]KNY28176.1 stress protein [Pseudobacteroides cellulosolvens ATCC 35603 = DSM 2933]
MCTYLVKGQRIDLANYLGNSSVLLLAFGWADSSISLDVSAFPLGSSEKVQFDDDFVFYNNPHTFDGGIILANDGKSINVDLVKIPERITKIAFSLSIYDDDLKIDNFSKLHGAYVQVICTVTKKVLLQYNLSQDMFSNERAIVAFEIYKYRDKWKFAAVGSGFTNGLAGICNLYGLEVESPTITPPITGGETANTTSRPLNLKKTWDKKVQPLRHLVLWGWDEDQNPSFLVLYGEHEFKNGNILCDDVKYDKYLIFKGKEGHLPAFKSIKKMNSWDFSHLAPYEKIVLPYFIGLTYEQIVEKIEFQNTKFHGFRIAKNPNMVMKLPECYSQHFNLFVGILGNQNIYMRKKMLNQLVKSNPPKEVYTLLFSIASTEAISGLFLELAKTSNPILFDEAKALIPSNMTWAEIGYAKGVKRCADIYITALDPILREGKIYWININVSKMDLKLIRIRGKDLPQDKVLDGAAYRKFAKKRYLRSLQQYYNWQTRQYINYPEHYEASHYSDGKSLKIIDFKNTLQEAEVLGLADIIGKIGYFVDAPRLTYYFKGNSNKKALEYFQRYIRRVINCYADTDEDKFIEALKALLTSYTNIDYVNDKGESFTFNKFIKFYLYNDFNEKPPENMQTWQQWRDYYEWFNTDHFMRIQGRYEYRKDIWDRHLDAAADIALEANIDPVVKACYFILKDSPNLNMFISNIEYDKLVKLALVSYYPLASMFMDILVKKVDSTNDFDMMLLLSFIRCSDKRLKSMALAYFERTGGRFTPEFAANFIMLPNLSDWADLFSTGIHNLSVEQFAAFLNHIIHNHQKGLNPDQVSENINDILMQHSSKVREADPSLRIKIFDSIINALFDIPKLPEWHCAFLEEVIFAYSFEELDEILKEVAIPLRAASSRNKKIISILEAIKCKNIPMDAQILDVLESSTSRIISMLLDIIAMFKENLIDKPSTILILLESEVPIANQLAKEVFSSLPQEKQKKLHSMIIDSPVERAYSFGLLQLDSIYGERIPGEFIVQMLEHGSPEVKAYISSKVDSTIENFSIETKELFIYYVKTLLLLPNRNSKSKQRVYDSLPRFVSTFPDKLSEIESILINIGASNIIIDAERALVALAKIRKEGAVHAG